MDYNISNWIFETVGDSKWFLNLTKIFTHLGDAVTIISIIAILLLFKKTRKLAIYMGITALVVFSLNNFVIKPIVARDRPFVSHPEFLSLLETASYDPPKSYSFASGHSITSMAVAVAVFMFYKKIGIAAMCCSLLIGSTRVILTVHYFSDVLVGFVLGAAVAVGMHYLIKFIESKINLEKRKVNMKTIVLATGNQHKLKEIREMMKDFTVVSLKDIGFVVDIEETGETMEANAKIKADAIYDYCKEKGLDYAVMADDSGLCVTELGGAPGVHSARYSGDHDDEANRQKLLSELDGSTDRTAYYECDICYRDDTETKIFVGRTYGKITTEKIGDESFCYDCLFFSDDLQKTFGESTEEEKNSVSHRGRAVEKLKNYLTKK